MYRKSDSDDAEAIALATLNMLDKLPDACTNDAYWSLGQLVHRRDNIMKQRTRLVNQYHLWNLKKRYGVSHAGSGKCWRKYVEQISNMWYYFKQMKQSALGSVFFFR